MSHDGFTENAVTKYLEPDPGSPYADQDLVFNDYGIPLIDNAFAGYNVCMFAYG